MRNSLIFEADDSLNVTFNNSNFILSEDDKRIIQDNWNKKIIDNELIYNGTVLALDKVSRNNQSLKLEFSMTDYAHFLASESKLLSTESHCKSFYVSALIETSDKQIAIGKMGQFSFEPGRLQFIGGGLEEKYVNGKTIETLKCVLDELEEEIAIKIEEKDCKPLYLSYGQIFNKFSIVYHVSVDIASNDLKKVLDNHNQKLISNDMIPEVDDLFFVNKNNYLEYFNNLKKINIDENLFSSIDSFFTGRTDDDVSLKDVLINE